jgi:hypothetical protein
MIIAPTTTHTTQSMAPSCPRSGYDPLKNYMSPPKTERHQGSVGPFTRPASPLRFLRGAPRRTERQGRRLADASVHVGPPTRGRTRPRAVRARTGPSHVIAGWERFEQSRLPAAPFGQMPCRFPVQPPVGGHQAAGLRISVLEETNRARRAGCRGRPRCARTTQAGGHRSSASRLVRRVSVMVTVAAAQRTLIAPGTKLL